MRFAEELHQEIAGVLRFGNTLDLRDPVKFVENLRFVYHVVRASEQLLHLAAEVSGGMLREYYLRHLEEERGHDEWVLADLEEAGINPFPCPRIAAQFAGSQYYHLLHTSAASLLGYMLVVEGFPTPLAVIEELETLHGRGLLRASRFHAEHDGQHRADLFKVINGLLPADQAVVRHVALHTAEQLLTAVRSMQGGL